jgi:hypothetical protein
MTQSESQPPWHRKRLLRSILMIGFGLIMLTWSLLVPPLKAFDPDLPSGFDVDGRIALLGLLAVSVGIVSALIYGMVWLKIGLIRAVRNHRKYVTRSR